LAVYGQQRPDGDELDLLVDVQGGQMFGIPAVRLAERHDLICTHGTAQSAQQEQRRPQPMTRPSPRRPGGTCRTDVNYSMRRPEMACAMTSCWISDVPSKIVWFNLTEVWLVRAVVVDAAEQVEHDRQ
jgi:hypothetical protein